MTEEEEAAPPMERHAELAKKDLVRAFVAMDILPRIR